MPTEPLTPERLAELRAYWFAGGHRHECENSPTGCGNEGRWCDMADVQALLDTIDAQAAVIAEAARAYRAGDWDVLEDALGFASIPDGPSVLVSEIRDMDDLPTDFGAPKAASRLVSGQEKDTSAEPAREDSI